ncbi:MAG: peptidyl-prolyl cis-trans isomerase, partial [Chloroflexi bacterium]|nr:peptidyl-prolyl cis-trans isomerase [Chloroflexota bacterium]
IYTGMDEDQFREIIMAQVYYDQLGEIIRDQAPLPDPSEQQGIIAVNVQDILMPSRQDALDVIDRVAGGESLLEVARSYDMAPSDGQTRRAVSRDQEGYPPAVIDAIFAAEEGDIIGPIPTDNGWYVARVLDQQLDILQPGDITQIRNEYYRQWIIERLDDPDYTVEYDNWQDYVPTDPLPQDVSPLMRDENFTLPDDQFAETGPTPTSQPLGISPR